MTSDFQTPGAPSEMFELHQQRRRSLMFNVNHYGAFFKERQSILLLKPLLPRYLFIVQHVAADNLFYIKGPTFSTNTYFSTAQNGFHRPGLVSPYTLFEFYM